MTSLTLLGGFRLAKNGREICLRSSKQRGLLAFLAMAAPEPQPRTTLTGLLWGSRSEEQARVSLRQAVRGIRQEVGDGVLISTKESISLSTDALDCDVHRYLSLSKDQSRESLLSATRMYGEFLRGLAVQADEFTDWQQRWRDRLADLQIDCLQRLAKLELAEGRAYEAIAQLERAAELDEFREDTHRLLMRALVAAGRRADALRHADRVSEMLHRELAIGPCSATAQLVQEIRNVSSLGTSSTHHVERRLDGTTGRAELTRKAPVAEEDEIRDAQSAYLTILYISLKNPENIVWGLEAEDVLNIRRDLLSIAGPILGRFGGHMYTNAEHGFWARFGGGSASEAAPENAITAALLIFDEWKASNSPANRPLAINLGGGVGTGNVILTGRSRDGSVSGGALFRASHLSRIPGDDGVLVDSRTYCLTKNAFEYALAGKYRDKSSQHHENVWRACRKRFIESRFATFRRAGSELIGRRAELSLCLELWEHAKEGTGRLLFITGEAGIGKSRLVQELIRRTAESDRDLWMFQCHPQGGDWPLHPLRSALQAAARDSAAEPAPEQLKELLTRFCPELRDWSGLLAHLAVDAREDVQHGPLSSVAPDEIRRIAVQATGALLRSLAQLKPQMIVVEDVHWADEFTTSIVSAAAHEAARLPVLIAITSREALWPDFVGEPHVSQVTLGRMSTVETDALTSAMWVSGPLPSGLAEAIHRRSDGIPLFAEELVSLAMTHPDAEKNPDWDRLFKARSPTLHHAVITRLDSIGSAKPVAQAASVIGREFPLALLRAVLGSVAPGIDFESEIRTLQQSGIIQASPAQPGSYRFRHSLVQDAAYASLLSNHRREMHDRVVSAVVDHGVHTMSQDSLAWHCEQAGRYSQALGCLLVAAESAIARGAIRDAEHMLKERAHSLLASLPAGRERNTQELRLLTLLGPVLMASEGWAAPDVERIYSRARTLATGGNDVRGLFPVLWGSWLFSHSRGDHQNTAKIVEDLLRLAEGEPDLALQAHHAAWATRICAGDLSGALDAIETGLRLYSREMHGRDALVYGGHDPGVCGLGHAAHVLWMMGFPDQATVRAEEALSLAHELGHAPSIIHALSFAGELRQLSRDAAGTAEIAKRMKACAGEHGFPLYVAIAEILDGWALAATGQPVQGLEQLRSGFDTCHQHRGEGLSSDIARMAEVLATAGKADEARRLIKKELERIDRCDQRLFEAELLRLLGDLSLLAPGPDQSLAEDLFRRAIAASRERRARTWELRATVSLARLWRDQGKKDLARHLLAPACMMFTEGLEKPDLRDAMRLLSEFVDAPE